MGYLENVENVFYSFKAFGVEVESGCCVELFESDLELKFDGFGRPAFPASDLISKVDKRDKEKKRVSECML